MNIYDERAKAKEEAEETEGEVEELEEEVKELDYTENKDVPVEQ